MGLLLSELAPDHAARLSAAAGVAAQIRSAAPPKACSAPPTLPSLLQSVYAPPSSPVYLDAVKLRSLPPASVASLLVVMPPHESAALLDRMALDDARFTSAVLVSMPDADCSAFLRRMGGSALAAVVAALQPAAADTEQPFALERARTAVLRAETASDSLAADEREKRSALAAELAAEMANLSGVARLASAAALRERALLAAMQQLSVADAHMRGEAGAAAESVEAEEQMLYEPPEAGATRAWLLGARF